MRSLLFIAALALASATSTSAATLTIVPNLPYNAVSDWYVAYDVGPITLNIYGDAEGATARGIYGRLQYDGSLVNNGTITQKLIGAGSDWVKGGVGDGDTNAAGPTTAFAEAFNQVSLN